MVASDRSLRPVALWLLGMAGLVAIMVLVGGATRLTDSGLSITQWDLVMGTLPPLNLAAWQEAFALYKQIPEYERVNAGMTLDEFKFIFWWEWGHRNLGRFIGLAFLIPFIVFMLMGRVRRLLRLRLAGLFLLICLQGAIGWYMVSSGLSERVDVSQYRLALHLSTALVLFVLLLWQGLALLRPRQLVEGGNEALTRLAAWLMALVSLQIVLGAFVAGLRAGLAYNTWPLMGGKIVPEEYFSETPRLLDLFERIPAAQFNHRTLAYLVAAFAGFFVYRAIKAGYRSLGLAVAGVIGVQIVLGIWAVLAMVPLWLGLAHQAGAVAILAVLTVAIYHLRPASARAAAAVPAQTARRAAPAT